MTQFNMSKFFEEASATNKKYLELRTQLREYAKTTEGRKAINSVDDYQHKIVFKLNYYPSDISPARLVTIATRLVASNN